MLFLVGALALPVLPIAAKATESQATYKVENLNDSELKMTFDHADVQLADGNAILKDHVTGEEQVLPKSSTDNNGDPVTLQYEKIDHGVLVKFVSQEPGQTSGTVSTQSVGGGAITGGGTLGLAGAAVGTFTIPGIGTVGAGAVGGATTGAAASCF
ncbi:Pathogenicity island protein [Bacillus halotolerans]|uniref:Pathogenicity island protein n=1 Tax=Bacillus halotolerans TaxID=260554 RepID=UPI00355C5F5B